MSATEPTSPEVLAAYAYCEQVTKTEARNFSYGIALLPADKRRALSAVYAFARRVDDIGDGDLPAADKVMALSAARAALAALAEGPASPPVDLVLVALADAARRFPIPLAAFGELIDGCEADVRGTRYQTFDELEAYCRCVAGAIGRLSLGVFGAADYAEAAPRADELGVALQLTNIIRDIREDLGTGRVYLPADDLARFGVTLEPGGELPADPAGLERVIRFEADRARTWYAAGLRLMPMLDWRSAASAGAMAGIYLRLLGHMSAAPATVLQRRMSLPAKEKIMVAVRSLAGRTPRPPAGAVAATSAGHVPAPGVPGAAITAADFAPARVGGTDAGPGAPPSEPAGSAQAARPATGEAP
jgi:phytoene synthase